jgi:hypothetical protein
MAMRRESSADYTLTMHQSSGAAVIGPRVFLTGVQSHNDTGSNRNPGCGQTKFTLP